MRVKTLTALLAFSILPSHANVLITEYVEGGGNNKVIEISNTGNSNVDLAVEGYKLSLYSNGKTTTTAELLLQGLLVPNSSLVVYNPNATDPFKKAAPQGLEDTKGAINFNGDDAIVLSNNTGIVDVFGQVGFDPGKSWGTGDLSTKDHTLRRLSSIIQGDNVQDDGFEPANEWQGFAKDSADGLGCIGENTCTGNEPLPEIGTPIEGGETPPTNSICTNCPDIPKIADRNQYDEATYYARALAATAPNFRSELIKDISANQKQFTYTEVWTALTYTDQDPTNPDNIILLYSGRSIAKKDNGSGSASTNQDFWNREHVWAKSHGFPDSSQRGYTDIHHLRPADVSMNSTRSDKDFAAGGDAVTEAPENSYTANTWEPRDTVKGDVARMMFYMDVRYDVGTDSTMPDLILVNQVGTPRTNLTDGKGELGKLCTLLEWHTLDPVDSFEIERNNTIYEYQGNRNPFIDHPEWVDIIYADACSTTNNQAPSVDAGNTQTVESKASVTLTATATDTDGTIATYQWTQLSGSMVTLTNNNSATASFTAPSVTSNTNLVFKIVVTDNQGASAEDTVTITVKAVPIAEPAQPDNSSSGGSVFYLLISSLLLIARRNKC